MLGKTGSECGLLGHISKSVIDIGTDRLHEEENQVPFFLSQDYEQEIVKASPDKSPGPQSHT